jgi:hypothetical protein
MAHGGRNFSLTGEPLPPAPLKDNPRPAWLWWPALQLSPHRRGPFMLLRHERSRHTGRSRP